MNTHQLTFTNRTAGETREVTDGRLREAIELHFHPEHGSAYWLRRQEQLGWSVRDRVWSREDLWGLGPMPTEDLRRFPVRDFIPRSFHRQLERFVIGETAGTSGEPRATAYRDEEFQTAFVSPFLDVAEATGFPRGVPWLFVGPSGPHLIAKAARELARKLGSMDPFTVDFDPRWVKRLADGSFAQQRYTEHVVRQALDVLHRESIGVLFTTPPTLTAMLKQMSDSEREAIRGVHYGGVSMEPSAVNNFRHAFPNAVHLAGYGNTLFGVLMEVADEPRQSMDYFHHDDRIEFHTISPAAAEICHDSWPPELLRQGHRGQLVFHRLDRSCLLVGIVERDEAECIAAPGPARALGWNEPGIRNPRPPARNRLRIGLY